MRRGRVSLGVKPPDVLGSRQLCPRPENRHGADGNSETEGVLEFAPGRRA